MTGVALEGGERIAADVVVSNADVLRTHELVGRRAPRRRLTPTMSCFLLYLGTDRTFDSLLHHTLLVGSGYRRFIRDVTRRGKIAPTFSTYVHAPTRSEPGMAPAGRRLAVRAAAGAQPAPRAGSTGIASPIACATRSSRISRRRSACAGSTDRSSSEHRMTPDDFERDLGAAWGNAFAVEPTLQQSAWLRPPNRDKRLRGLYFVGGGTHPGAGIPGVLLGAEVTAGLVARDHPARRRPHAAAPG